MEITYCIRERRSIRMYDSRMIDDEIIYKLIEAAIHAPSACNMQAWKFIIVNSKEQIDKLISKGAARWINTAPCGILVTYRNDITVNGKLYKDHYQSASAAIQNMMLEATNLGLAACWVCDLPRPKYVRKLFHIPKQFDIIAYIPIGYPKIDETNLSIKHYGDKQNYKAHTRKYTIKQVVSFDAFKISDKDCTHVPAKNILPLRRLLLKRKLLFGSFFTDHMLKK